MGAQSILVKIGLGQALEGILTTVLHRGGRGEIIEIDSADRGKIFGLWWVTRQDLTDLVDDSVTSGTERLDDFELDGGGVEIVVAVVMTGGNGKKPNSFTLEIKPLTDNITWKENVLHRRRGHGSSPRVLGDRGTGGVKRRKGGRTRNGTGRRDAGGVGRKRDRRRPRRSSDGGGKIDGQHGVGCPDGTISRDTTTRTIGGLFSGQILRIL